MPRLHKAGFKEQEQQATSLTECALVYCFEVIQIIVVGPFSINVLHPFRTEIRRQSFEAANFLFIKRSCLSIPLTGLRPLYH